MRGKSSSSKVVAVAVSLAIIFSCAPIVGIPSRARAQSLDPGDMLSIPIKSFTSAAEKFARVGGSVGGIPIPFTSLDSIMKLAVKQILNKLNGSILSWINIGKGTADNPDPMFITDLNEYMNQVRDSSGSQYLSDNKGNFCGYFSSDLDESLATYFDIEDSGGGGGSCDFDQYANQGFLNDFNQGGWEAWSSLTQTANNNPMGAWLTQKEAMNAKIQQDQANAKEEADWGNGSPGQKDSNGKIITPGKVISDQLSFIMTSDQRQLENAKSFDDIITTLTNSLMTKAIHGVSSSINGSSKVGVSSLTSKTLRDTSSQHLAFPGSQLDTTQKESKNIAPQYVGHTKQVSPSSQMHGPDVAINGLNNRDYTMGGVSLTGKADNPWWQVDLGKVMPITSVNVIAASDTNTFPLTDAYVYISVDPIPRSDKNVPPTSGDTWRSDKNPNGAGSFRTTLPQPILGRYVGVERAGSDIQLGIAGVEILADSVPKIYIAGDNPIDAQVNEIFTDPGYTATDDTDGDITRKVTVSWSKLLSGGATAPVSATEATSTPGTYIITYSVTNSAHISNMVGLTKPVTRTVVVQ